MAGIFEIRTMDDPFKEIKDLIDWYKLNHKTHYHPTEIEVSCSLVCPLLKALHWPSKNISFERAVPCLTGTSKRLDIALHYTDDRRDSDQIKGIIEVKKHGKFNKVKWIEKAKKQACGYTSSFNKLKFFAVTDGYTYQVYSHGPLETFENQTTLEVSNSSYDDFMSHLGYQ